MGAHVDGTLRHRAGLLRLTFDLAPETSYVLHLASRLFRVV